MLSQVWILQHLVKRVGPGVVPICHITGVHYITSAQYWVFQLHNTECQIALWIFPPKPGLTNYGDVSNFVNFVPETKITVRP